jgi:hypothetical protein
LSNELTARLVIQEHALPLGCGTRPLDSGNPVWREDPGFQAAGDHAQRSGSACHSVLYIKGEGAPQGYVLAHLCLNLVASRLPLGEMRGCAVIGRGTIAAKMTSEQIVEAQLLVRTWRAKPP